MPRTSPNAADKHPFGISSLGPALFRAPADLAPQPQPIARVEMSARRDRPGLARTARLAVIGLGLAGILPPLAFTARPGELGLVLGVPISIALTALLILAPALVGLATAVFGFEGVRDSFRARGDKEHEQAVLRVFVAALAVVYAFALAGYGDAAASCRIVAALGLAGAWVFLLLAILDPIASPLRHYAGAIYDAALLAVFLHVGAVLTAPWFPLFLLGTFYAGFRFGARSLGVAAVANLVGFAAVVATTLFWQQQVLLAAGLLIAMVVLPTYVASMAREVAQSRAAAAAAQAARTRFLMVISQALRAPLDAFVGTAGAAVERAAPEAAQPAIRPSARALLSQVSNILDFSAIEAGAFVPEVEAFDLHQLINETLADRRAEARSRGSRLRVHVDPALPYRLRGWPQQLGQIIDYLVARAIEVTASGAVRIAIDAAGRNGGALNLRIAVRDGGAPIPPGDADSLFNPFSGAASRQNAGAHGAFGLAVVKRLVELMGGRIAVESGTARGGSLMITVPLAIDEPEIDSTLDLGRCLVLIATEDSQFASDLAEPLNAWHGDPRWIEGFGGTLGFERRETGASSVLIVDGRSHMLAALSFAHRAVTSPAAPSFVLVVADRAQIDGLIELADGELDGVLPAPLDYQLLANALHSLPLARGLSPRPVMVPETIEPVAEPEPPPAAIQEPVPLPEPVPAPASQVTPIAVHPRFGAETQIVDPRAIAALRGLGGGDEFLAEIIDSFRAETKEIMNRVVRAAAAADTANFARGLHALRSCAANLGGTRLCELLLAMRDISQRELREQGSGVVQKLGDELARLDTALAEFLPDRGVAVRRGA